MVPIFFVKLASHASNENHKWWTGSNHKKTIYAMPWWSRYKTNYIIFCKENQNLHTKKAMSQKNGLPLYLIDFL